MVFFVFLAFRAIFVGYFLSFDVQTGGGSSFRIFSAHHYLIQQTIAPGGYFLTPQVPPSSVN